MEMIVLQIEIFLLIALGYFLTKTGKISKQTQTQLTDLVLAVFLPAAIVQSFELDMTVDILKSCLYVLIASILIQILYWICMKTFWNKISDPRRKICLQYGTMVSNAGFMGMPIAQAAFGAQGLLYASIFLIPQRICMWSTGLSLYAAGSSWKETVLRVLKHPCIIALEVGVVVMLLEMVGIHMPEFLDKSISALAGCNTALCMIVIGSILSEVPFKEMKDPICWIYSVIRLVLLPLVVYLLCFVFRFTGLGMAVCVMETAMPAPNTLVMLAQKYDKDPKFGARLVCVSTLLSIVILPVWMMLLSAQVG